MRFLNVALVIMATFGVLTSNLLARDDFDPDEDDDFYKTIDAKAAQEEAQSILELLKRTDWGQSEWLHFFHAYLSRADADFASPTIREQFITVTFPDVLNKLIRLRENGLDPQKAEVIRTALEGVFKTRKDYRLTPDSKIIEIANLMKDRIRNQRAFTLKELSELSEKIRENILASDLSSVTRTRFIIYYFKLLDHPQLSESDRIRLLEGTAQSVFDMIAREVDNGNEGYKPHRDKLLKVDMKYPRSEHIKQTENGPFRQGEIAEAPSSNLPTNPQSGGLSAGSPAAGAPVKAPAVKRPGRLQGYDLQLNVIPIDNIDQRVRADVDFSSDSAAKLTIWLPYELYTRLGQIAGSRSRESIIEERALDRILGEGVFVEASLANSFHEGKQIDHREVRFYGLDEAIPLQQFLSEKTGDVIGALGIRLALLRGESDFAWILSKEDLAVLGAAPTFRQFLALKLGQPGRTSPAWRHIYRSSKAKLIRIDCKQMLKTANSNPPPQ